MEITVLDDSLISERIKGRRQNITIKASQMQMTDSLTKFLRSCDYYCKMLKFNLLYLVSNHQFTLSGTCQWRGTLQAVSE